MTQNYEFKLILADTGDEFSDNFNPTSETEVEEFERNILDALQSDGWNVESVELKRVVVNL